VLSLKLIMLLRNRKLASEKKEEEVSNADFFISTAPDQTLGNEDGHEEEEIQVELSKKRKGQKEDRKARKKARKLKRKTHEK